MSDTKTLTIERSVFERLWTGFKRLSDYPNGHVGEKQKRAVSICIYLIVLAAAGVVVYDIARRGQFHTEVHERNDILHLIPDMLFCPHIPKIPFDHYHPDRRPLERTYKVWYQRHSLNDLNMTDADLDLLAQYARERRLPQQKQTHLINTYKGRLLEALKKEMPDIDPVHHNSVNNPFQLTTNINAVRLGRHFYAPENQLKNERENWNDLDALWTFVAFPSPYQIQLTKELVHSEGTDWPIRYSQDAPYCAPQIDGSSAWCFVNSDVVWMGNEQCWLMHFTENTGMINSVHSVRHWFFNWALTFVKNPQLTPIEAFEGFGVKMWMGNLNVERLTADSLWPIWPDGEETVSPYNEYDAYRITDEFQPKMSVCQDPTLFAYSRLERCTPRPMTTYWMYKLGHQGGRGTVAIWTYPQKIKHIVKKRSYTTLQQFELYGGVIGCMTGVSVLQLMELAVFVLRRKLKVRPILLRSLELLTMLLLVALSAYLIFMDIRFITGLSQYVTVKEQQSLDVDGGIVQ